MTPILLRLFSITFLCLALHLKVFAQIPSILEKLALCIQKSSDFDQRKIHRIDSLRSLLQQYPVINQERRFELNRALFNEYNVFKRDSAFHYGIETRRLAQVLNDTSLIASSVINLADICVSAGMYPEALDFLGEINPEETPSNIRSLYFGLIGRCYSEMAEYNNFPYFSTEYDRKASDFRGVALLLTEEGTFFNRFLEAFIIYNNGDANQALAKFSALKDLPLSLRDHALVHYMLGDIYSHLEQTDKAINHYAQSAIDDIKTSTKENLAMIRLAELLFRQDEIKYASLFIKKANEDARFYGAQQRKLRIGAILPLIEEKIINQIEQQRKRLYWQNIGLAILLIFVIGLAFITKTQVNKLKKAKQIIDDAHQNQQNTNLRIVAINEKISSANAQLKHLNQQLFETSKIKEEYIGFFFTQDAEMLEKFDTFRNTIRKNLENDNIDKVKYLLSDYNLKKEKGKLLRNFDEAFIRLFPDFIEEFNSLLKPNEHILLKKGQLLNKELRIFALIRLGIHHNEIIAQILGYSVNSIYAYKTKIRKKSMVDTRDFDEKLIKNTTLRP